MKTVLSSLFVLFSSTLFAADYPVRWQVSEGLANPENASLTLILVSSFFLMLTVRARRRWKWLYLKNKPQRESHRPAMVYRTERA